MTKRIILYGGCIGALIFLLLPMMGFVFYRDWAFIDENTASRKGYRQYWIGLRTGHWYRASAVEKFVVSKFPKELKHRWTSYAGTGKNIFDMTVLYGHGRPGSILQIDEKILNDWFSTRSDAEKKAFYDMLVSGNNQAIQDKINSIMNELINNPYEEESNLSVHPR